MAVIPRGRSSFDPILGRSFLETRQAGWYEKSKAMFDRDFTTDFVQRLDIMASGRSTALDALGRQEARAAAGLPSGLNPNELTFGQDHMPEYFGSPQEIEREQEITQLDEGLVSRDAKRSSARLVRPGQGRIKPDQRFFMTVEEFAERNKDLGITASRPLTLVEEAERRSAKIQQLVSDQIGAMGPTGLYGLSADLAGGLVGSFLDPIDAASMFIPIVGPGGRTALAARFGGHAYGRIARGAIEGAAGTAITEPFFYALNQHFEVDYTMYDALFTVGMGGIFGAALGAGAA